MNIPAVANRSVLESVAGWSISWNSCGDGSHLARFEINPSLFVDSARADPTRDRDGSSVKS